MMDLDGFKPVNDSEGHEAGDRMLAVIAQTIAGGLREGDFVARLGGDEFAALLPRTDVGEAEALAERLRARVQDAGSDASVTASIGVAMLKDDVRRALLRADGALYEAKSSGRNVASAASRTSAGTVSVIGLLHRFAILACSMLRVVLPRTAKQAFVSLFSSLPTLVVTDADGRIVFADQTDNCRVRPTPDTVLAALRGVSQPRRSPEAP